MEYLKKFNELPFRSELLEKHSNIGRYEFYVDGSTGWGIIFDEGYIEVEEGPHESVGFMNGEVNGISHTARGKAVTRIPDEYWQGEMSDAKLAKFFNDLVTKYKQ